MNDLRGALIVLGAVFLAGLALWERRRAARRGGITLPEGPPGAAASGLRRVEPSIGDFAGRDADDEAEDIVVPTIHPVGRPVDSVRIAVLPEPAVDVPAAVQPRAPAPVPPPAPAGGIRWPPEKVSRVLSLRVLRAGEAALPGRALRQALEAAGMVHGPQRIFHLLDRQGHVRASAANLLRPGDLDPAQMDAQEFRGLSLFSVLPGPLPPEATLEALVQLARGIAARLDAVVQDDRGAALDAEHLTQLRRSLQAQPQADHDPP